MEEEPARKKAKADPVASMANAATVIVIPDDDPVSDEIKRVSEALDERLKSHNDNRISVQERLHEVCEGRRKQVDNFEDIINGELEVKFIDEDNRLQNALGSLKTAFSEGDKSKLDEALQNAKTELFVSQNYKLVAGEVKDFTSIGKLSTKKFFVPEWLDSPKNVRIIEEEHPGKICLSSISRQESMLVERGLIIPFFFFTVLF